MLEENETIGIPSVLSMQGESLNQWTQIITNVNIFMFESMQKPIAEAQYEVQSKVNNYLNFMRNMDEMPVIIDVVTMSEYTFTRVEIIADLEKGILNLLPIWKVEHE